MAVTADKPGPYTSPSAILDIIDRYRSRGLPTPVNADVLGRAGISLGLIPRTIHSLQTLELIGEDGKPTKTFDALRLAPEDEFKTRLAEWLKAVYADVFAFVDPSKDDEVRVRDAFRTYQPVGQQSRMVTLFQGLCTAAGLSPEKTVPTNRAPAASRSSPRNVSPIAKRNLATLSGKNRSGITPSTGIPAPVAGLLSSLPQEGEGWTKETRQKFLDTFETVLDFCFPVVTRNAKDDQEEDAPE